MRLYPHTFVLFSLFTRPVMRFFFLSVALSIKAAVPFPDGNEWPGTDLQIPTVDTGLLKIYRPGSDVPVSFLDAISTDFEVVPAEIASGGNSCLSRRYYTEKKGRIDRRGSCPVPSPTVKEPATQEPPTDGRGYPRPVHTRSSWSGDSRPSNQASAQATRETTGPSTFTSTNQSNLW